MGLCYVLYGNCSAEVLHFAIQPTEFLDLATGISQ
jgi:hypothetical protein